MIKTKIFLKSGHVLTFNLESVTVSTDKASGDIVQFEMVPHSSEPRCLLDVQLDQIAAVTTEEIIE